MRKWQIEDSAELYNINGWGIDYFSINEKGNVTVTPKKDASPIELIRHCRRAQTAGCIVANTTPVY